MNAWLVSSYRVMKEAALQDHDVWDTPRIADALVSPIKGMSKEQWIEFFGPKASAIALLNGQAYNEQHRWWFAMFSPRVLKEWGDTLIEPIANRMVDAFIDRGHAELCEEYGERISPRVMTAVRTSSAWSGATQRRCSAPTTTSRTSSQRPPPRSSPAPGRRPPPSATPCT